MWTDEEIERAAWALAEDDGFRYGRCGNISQYFNHVKDVLNKLERARIDITTDEVWDERYCTCTGDALSGIITCDYCMEVYKF